VRNGHRKDGKQRYLCKVCDKSFVSNTNSITSGTKKGLYVWMKYIECMINGLPLRESAFICKIHRNTAFMWRHKVLVALQKITEDINLSGIVEADETFFPVSYKGNHKKSSFKLPRIVHKRGKSIHTRGLSYEQVCVPCALDRNGNSISKISNLVRIKTKDLHYVFDGKIEEKATLCTDRMNSYVRFANSNKIQREGLMLHHYL